MGKRMTHAKITAVLVIIMAIAVSAAVIHNTMMSQEALRYGPMKDAVVEFIASNHPDAGAFLANVSFTYLGGGGFTGGGWVLNLMGSTMNGTAAADFSIARTQNSTGIPHRIFWSGTIVNGTVAETGYSHAV